MNIDRSLLKNYDSADTPAGGAPPLPPDGRRPVAQQLHRPVPRGNDVVPPSRVVAPPRVVSQEPPTPTPIAPPAQGSNTNINISISMPKLKKPTLPNWDYKRIGIWAGAVVGLIVASLIVHAVIVAIIEHNKENAAKHRIDMIDQRKTPTFKPLVPKSSAEVAKTAAYDSKRDTYSYNDTVKGLGVIVSQQRMPSGAPTDSTVAKIAKSMNATTPIIASKGTAYMSSNAGGAQTIVMGSGSLLVFVQSAFTHSPDDWKSYLDTLQS